MAKETQIPSLLGQFDSIQSLVQAAASDYPRVWRIVRDGMEESERRTPPGLLRDVLGFCRTVFETFAPGISESERVIRRQQVGAAAVLLNIKIPEAFRALKTGDYEFFTKWRTIECWLSPNDKTLLEFERERTMLADQELAFSVLFYSLYTTLYLRAYGTFPAGLIWPTSLAFGIGHALR